MASPVGCAAAASMCGVRSPGESTPQRHRKRCTQEDLRRKWRWPRSRDSGSPAAKGKVRRALESISKALGGLHVRTGNDELGGFAVKMCGVTKRKMVAVRAFFINRMAMA